MRVVSVNKRREELQLVTFDARRVARRSRDDSRAPAMRGSFVAWPKIGMPLVVRWENCAELMITGPVVRMLMSADGPTLYVETTHNTYRLALSTPIDI